MSKTSKFTIGERLALEKIFNAFKGSMTEMSTLLDDVKQVPITKDEWTAAGRVLLGKDGQPKADQEVAIDGDSIKWQEGDEKTWKEMTFKPDTIAYVQRTIKERSDKNELTLVDIPLISIQKKLV